VQCLAVGQLHPRARATWPPRQREDVAADLRLPARSLGPWHVYKVVPEVRCGNADCRNYSARRDARAG